MWIILSSSLQTGITVIDNVSHHSVKKTQRYSGSSSHTVNGYGDCLGQFVAIGANEGGNFSQRVDLKIVRGELVWWFRVDYVKIKLVGFSHYSNRSGTWVSLCMVLSIS